MNIFPNLNTFSTQDINFIKDNENDNDDDNDDQTSNFIFAEEMKNRKDFYFHQLIKQKR